MVIVFQIIFFYWFHTWKRSFPNTPRSGHRVSISMIGIQKLAPKGKSLKKT